MTIKEKYMSNADANKKIDGYQMGQSHILETIWLKYKGNSEGLWITKMTQVLRLYEYLKHLQPKHILELGTGIGCSAEIMALACPNTSVYTVEQNQKCIDAAKILIPERLQEQIYFKLSQVGVLKPLYGVNPWINFQAYITPYDWKDYDFIYIDGPGPFIAYKTDPETQEKWESLVELPGGDLILLLNRMNEGTIVYVDGRKQMVSLYKRHLSHYLELLEETMDHTIFRRNARMLKPDFSDFMNSDTYLKVLKDNKYFNTKLDE